VVPDAIEGEEGANAAGNSDTVASLIAGVGHMRGRKRDDGTRERLRVWPEQVIAYAHIMARVALTAALFSA